ncbi:MAG: hypothetical protein ACYC4S_00630 [Rhodoferax sp.]
MNALQADLVAGATVAGARVYLDRVDALQASDLPAIVIEDRGETAEVIELDDTQQRQSTFAVHCVLAHGTLAASEARAFGLAVEKVIAGSAAVKALAHLGIYIASAQTEINGEGDRLLASRDQVWQASYLVHPTNPEIINP